MKKTNKRKPLKETIVFLGGLIAGLSMLIVIVMMIWSSNDKGNLAAAKVAFAEGNYNSAIEYYSKLMPLNEERSNAKLIKSAATSYEQAVNSNELYKYIDALEHCTNALEAYPEFNLASNLLDEVKVSLGRYFKKMYDKRDYKAAYVAINQLDKEYHNEQTSAIIASINEMLEANVDAGEAALERYQLVQAVNYANMTLDIEPNHEEANKLLEDVEIYKQYRKNIEKATDYYDNNDIKAAYNEYSKIESNKYGSKTKAEFQEIVDKIENDYQHMEKPIIIDNKNALGYYSEFHNEDSVEFEFTLNNNLYKPVKVKVEFTYNKDIEYLVYNLKGKEVLNVKTTIDNLFVNSLENMYSINVDEFVIE